MKPKSNHRGTDHSTKNSLPAETRSKVIDSLNARVADAIDLFYAVRTAHFNVKGPSFGSLHELFETIYKAVDEFVDMMAERAVQLGGIARSTVRIAADKSNLEEYPTDIVDGIDHCDAVSDRLAAFGKLLRADIDAFDDAGDKGSSDMLVDIVRAIDKFTWMVEAHTQADR